MTDSAPGLIGRGRVTTWTDVAWAIALLLLPLQAVWTFAWLGGRFQPAEVGSFLVAVAAAGVWWRGSLPRMNGVDAAVLGWLAALLLSWAMTGGTTRPSGTLEVVGALYLGGLYAAVRVTASQDRARLAVRWYTRAVVISAALGLAGVVLAWSGRWTILTAPPTAVLPYLGMTARAQAFTPGPQMLANLLLVAIPLALARGSAHGWSRAHATFVVLLGMGLLASQSKTALCVIVAISVMYAALGRRRAWSIAAAVTATLVYLTATHVVVANASDVPLLESAQVIAGRPLFEFSCGSTRCVVAPTTYVANKAASLDAIREHWPVGLGPAGQAPYARALQEAGRYPGTVGLDRIREPHSTYLGIAAELGLPGTLAGLVLILAVSRRLVGWRRAAPNDRYVAAVCGIAVAVLVEATATDLMSSRHYWWLLAALASAGPRPRR